jgi:uncharacterized protein YecT (DUF1311 family)
MKPILLVGITLSIIALSACSLQPIKSAPTPETTPVYNCSSATTQFELNQCASRMSQTEQEKLNSLINELQGHMDASQYAELLRIEADWETVAKDHCKWEAAFFTGGSNQPMMLADCLYRQYQQRIDILRLNLCNGNGMTGECEASLKYK